jgi:hypothetical protein
MRRESPCRIGSGGEEAHSRVPALQAKEAEVDEAVWLLKVRGRPVGHIHDRPVEWEEIPESYEEPDNKSAKEHYAFVREEVKRLVEAGQVVEWPCRPRCTNLLTVATKVRDDGSIKKRLVLDLSRCVNLTLASDDFRMVTLQDAINATQEGSFQLVFDLKSAFHHIRLHPSCYELMGFKVDREDGQVVYYCFVVLVFGL